VEKYHSDGAKIVLMTMGSVGETASVAVDQMRAAGKDVGLVRLRLWRPFPFEELREAVKDADILIILDRDISFGGPGGVISSEVRAALYNQAKRPKVVSFVGGLGGRDVTTANFQDIVDKAVEIAAKGSKNEYEIYGVRE
jgi:pyruvate ferredoxin oxidoreductase alpha subunit